MADNQRKDARLKVAATDWSTNPAIGAQARHLRYLQRRVVTLERHLHEAQQTRAWRLSALLGAGERRVRKSIHITRWLWISWPRLYSLIRRRLTQGGLPELFAELKRRRGQSPSIARSGAVSATKRARVAPFNTLNGDRFRLSIILIIEIKEKITYDRLRLIADQAEVAPDEVLLVTSDSTTTAAMIAALAAMPVLRIPDLNAGSSLLNRCQQAARQARGCALLFLSEQALMPPNAIAALFGTLSFNSEIGVVGAVTPMRLTPSHRLSDAAQILSSDGSVTPVGAGEHPETPAYAYLREVDAGSLSCLMLSTQAYRQVGGLDASYETLEYAGIDLCLALRAQGWRVLYQPDAELIQANTESPTSDRVQGLPPQGSLSDSPALQRDQQRFREKWAPELLGYLPPGVAARTERDRLPGPRLLWVEACMLTPDQDSGSLRTLRLMTILQALGCKISFAADRLERQEPYTHQLQQRGIEVLYRPYQRSVASLIEQQAEDYDLIILSRHYVARRYAALVRRVAPHALLVFDSVDLHWLRLRRQQAWDQDPMLPRLAEIAYRDECALARQCDLTLVVSDVEAQALQQAVPSARIEILSNVHDPVAEVPDIEGRHDLLFVGGFQHPPNVDAVEYFAREIWPLFHAQRPEAKAYVIGSRLPASLRALGEQRGLCMLGYVKDLESYLRGCRFSIAPLRYGAGVKGKVNQSLSHGLPVVATSVAIEGMRVTHEQELLVADRPADFVQAMRRLDEDDALWRQLSKAGQARMAEQFGTAVARAKLQELLDLVQRKMRVGAQI
ncbi:MAG: hypothetical protein C1943_11355 [Halochromatium sp.]|nr:hypothetical protein [Halochromatium sp.]